MYMKNPLLPSLWQSGWGGDLARRAKSLPSGYSTIDGVFTGGGALDIIILVFGSEPEGIGVGHEADGPRMTFRKVPIGSKPTSLLRARSGKPFAHTLLLKLMEKGLDCDCPVRLVGQLS